MFSYLWTPSIKHLYFFPPFESKFKPYFLRNGFKIKKMQTVCAAQRRSSVKYPNSKSANIYILQGVNASNYTLQWMLLWVRLQEWGQRCKVSVTQPIKIYSSRMTLRNTSRLPCNQPSTSSWRHAAGRETLTGYISAHLFIYLRGLVCRLLFLAHLFKIWCFPDIWRISNWISFIRL